MRSLEHRLAAAGAARVEAETARLETGATLRRVVREAHDAGWPKTRIAEVAGVSRQTIHDILKDK